MTPKQTEPRSYVFANGEFLYTRGDGETNAVATVNEAGEIVFNEGYRSQHGKSLSAWLEANKMNFGEPKAEPTPPDEVVPPAEPVEQTPDVVEAPVEVEIPDELLPKFDRRLGTRTPEFMAFVEKHNLSDAQVVGIVRRLEHK